MDIIRDGTMGLERSSVQYYHVAGAVKIRYQHPFMLPFTWQLVWGVLGAHAQRQTEGTRPKRPTTPPAHTRGARPAWPHRGWRISHARHFSAARGARHGWRAPGRTSQDALPSHSSWLQPSGSRKRQLDSCGVGRQPPPTRRRCAVERRAALGRPEVVRPRGFACYLLQDDVRAGEAGRLRSCDVRAHARRPLRQRRVSTHGTRRGELGDRSAALTARTAPHRPAPRRQLLRAGSDWAARRLCRPSPP